MEAEPQSFADIGRELESLKQSLIYTDADGISTEDTVALAQEISAIRLQLKRLEFDREAVQATLDSLHDIENGKSPDARGFEADDGTRTHDLLHGKQTL